MTDQDTPTGHLAIVGAGVIGLSCGWRAARAGWSVTLVDPEPARGSSWVAGGMLAPVTEAWPGEEELLELGASSVAGWPDFAAELAEAAGRPSGLRTEGTVVVAAAAGDRAELDELAGNPRSARTCAAGCRCRATSRWTTGCCSPRCGRPPRPPG
jgi:glycine oxidase